MGQNLLKKYIEKDVSCDTDIVGQNYKKEAFVQI